MKSAFSRDGGKSVTRIFLHHFGWEKKPKHQNMSKKWKSTQFPVVSGVEEGRGKAPEVVSKEKTFHPAGMQVLILLYF